ncbi:hypothetical protein H6503_00490 [Candidatus Woesearchaeota archaeon]|nr:hypothetical protein [Candidatus Woesearchaeota archaeon]
MDKISEEEIRKAMDEYDHEGSSTSKSMNSQSKKSPKARENKFSLFKKISNSLSGQDMVGSDANITSAEYRQFLDENKPMIHSWYEKACRFSGNLIKISPGKDKKPEIEAALKTAHLNVSAEDAFSFAIIGPILLMLGGILISFLLLNGDFFFVSFFLLAGIGTMIPLTKLPMIFASITRMKSSKEIVLSVFYIVTYMRQNSNLEKAIEFASQHLNGPLAAELKKVLWNVESQTYGTIKESLDEYMEKWRKTNAEFLEAMNLIESSLYEPSEENRIGLLDKALDVILTETYEKMLHYSHDIQSPISTLHMLGVILPILGLVILPLVVSFMENVEWYHIAILYNVVIPIAVYFVGKNILSTRPGGYGSGEIASDNPMVVEKKKKNKKFMGKELTPLFMGLAVFLPLFLLGISPILLHWSLGPGNDITLFHSEYSDNWYNDMKFLDYREAKGTSAEYGDVEYKGPYGLFATLLGVLFVLSFGLGFGTYYYYKTKDIIFIREETRKLEDEFGSAIFQLGNRLGDGIPLEMSFSKVVEVMQDSQPGKFFGIIDSNIRRMGMNPEQAIFDKRLGAIRFFPSNLIESTMKVLTEAIKKGPMIASRAMTNVARYVKEMHSVEERLRDLLAEVISSMSSLVKFLAPVISGIVVGITAMITNIIGNLRTSLGQFGTDAAESGGALAGLTEMFGDGIPTYAFQIVVGIYIVQVVWIMSKTIAGISYGDDKLGEEYTIGQNMLRSVTLYCIIAAVITIIFTIIALSVLGRAITAEIV